MARNQKVKTGICYRQTPFSQILMYILYSFMRNTKLFILFLGVKLGGECQNTKQCLVITANSTCSDGVCSCQSGYFAISEVNISFCETSKLVHFLSPLFSQLVKNYNINTNFWAVFLTLFWIDKFAVFNPKSMTIKYDKFYV